MDVCIINLGKARAKKCLSNKFIVLLCRYGKASQSKDKKLKLKLDAKQGQKKAQMNSLVVLREHLVPLLPPFWSHLIRIVTWSIM